MKYASRKYIDLILEASSKWASWDPPHSIKVGDYGTIDKDTGRFEKDGNVYEDPETKELCKEYPPEILAPERDVVFSSQAEQGRDFVLGPAVDIGIAEASIKGEWKFKTGKTGALLVMARPRSTSIVSNSANALLKKLVDVPLLKTKYLVTETMACHAYSLYLSTKSEDKVSLALVAKTPIPAAPFVSAGGEISCAWWKETGGGVFRHGCDLPDKYSFTPLVMLKRVRKKRMGSYRGAPPPEAEELWEDVECPWRPLDEEGEEFEDTVYDWES
ncbi:hypothetical protein DFH06DRAFT_1195307 [Mycena polygramma]|nr:hypothetical protein DFH06DRAFT_1195307 [Mycena polygramma]